MLVWVWELGSPVNHTVGIHPFLIWVFKTMHPRKVHKVGTQCLFAAFGWHQSFAVQIRHYAKAQSTQLVLNASSSGASLMAQWVESAHNVGNPE